MADKTLVLLISDRMDNNKKSDRNEHGLVRMAAVTRSTLKLNTNKINLQATENSDAIQLELFQSFKDDIEKAKNKIDEGVLSKSDYEKLGFVTTNTYNKIIGKRKNNTVLIVDNSVTKKYIIDKLLIGTDPEFLLFNGEGQVIRATSVLSKTGKLGCDGAMAELRPDPDNSPEGVISNLISILQNPKMTQPINPYLWKAECYHKDNSRDYPVGGHIHIDNPKPVAQMAQGNRYLFFQSLNKILDELLAVPLIKFDGAAKGSARRTKCQITLNNGPGYGYFGEWRHSNGHFEHRTLSGLWMAHPILAQAVLGTAMAIAKEAFQLGANNDYSLDYLFPIKFTGSSIWDDSFDHWKEIPLTRDMGCGAASKILRKLLHESDASLITKEYLKRWHNKLKSMSTYNKHSKYIDLLFELLNHTKKEFDEYGTNIKENWLEDKKYMVEV